MKLRLEKAISVLSLSKVATMATNTAGLASISYFWMDDEDVVDGANGGVLRGLLVARSTDLEGNAIGISVSTPLNTKVEIETVKGKAAFKLTPRKGTTYCAAQSRTVGVIAGGKVVAGNTTFGIVN